MTETPSSVDDNLILLDGLEAFGKHALQVVSQTRRNLYILSDSLDSPLYDNGAMQTAISRLARKDRNAEVRMLVKNTRQLVEQNHTLLQLARRLPSKIKMRKLLIEPEDNDRAYLIGDRDLLLYKHDEREYAGFANYRAGPEALNILEDFHYLWERQSAEDIELRAFTL